MKDAIYLREAATRLCTPTSEYKNMTAFVTDCLETIKEVDYKSFPELFDVDEEGVDILLAKKTTNTNFFALSKPLREKLQEQLCHQTFGNHSELQKRSTLKWMILFDLNLEDPRLDQVFVQNQLPKIIQATKDLAANAHGNTAAPTTSNLKNPLLSTVVSNWNFPTPPPSSTSSSSSSSNTQNISKDLIQTASTSTNHKSKEKTEEENQSRRTCKQQ